MPVINKNHSESWRLVGTANEVMDSLQHITILLIIICISHLNLAIFAIPYLRGMCRGTNKRTIQYCQIFQYIKYLATVHFSEQYQ
uniref:Uncharacterized protein n=1 Tax=Pyxicephalus adspersus TaxID=30357 RepID=A0AAV3AYZ1_PYXAD|nr:TPA: hypothetical protein GDO54_007556 [Pyxicephalus adspersus]